MMQYSIAQQSNIGGRKNNEDSVMIIEREDAVLLLLGDGLGGHEGGELASQTLIDSISYSFKNTTPEQLADPTGFLFLSIGYAHKMIHRQAVEAGLSEVSPKTTCVACIIQNERAYWAHVGDSRLYILRDGKFIFQTEDHISHEYGSLSNAPINRCVGGVETPRPTLGEPFDLRDGDSILLCSDGAWRSLRSEDLQNYIDPLSPQDGLERLLIRLEKRNPHPSDNLTAALLYWGIDVEKSEQVELSDETRRELDEALKPKKVASNGMADISSGNIDDVINELENYINEFDDKI